MNVRYSTLTANAIVLLAVMLPTLTQAQCVKGAVVCNTLTGPDRRVCSASVMCGGFTSSVVFVDTTVMNNATCTPTSTSYNTPATFSIMGTVLLPLPTTAQCGWSWASASLPSTGNFSITGADGLPVELMDFSVDDG